MSVKGCVAGSSWKWKSLPMARNLTSTGSLVPASALAARLALGWLYTTVGWNTEQYKSITFTHSL